jgi:1-acyl-sn-glycerol-3-phosphate acyltransferase
VEPRPAPAALTPVVLARNLVALAWTVLCFLLVSVVAIGSVGLLAAPLASTFPRLWGRTVLAILGVRVTFVGEERLADIRAGRVGPSWPCVMVTNHQSTLDVPLAGLLGPRYPLVMGKAELRYLPVFNLLWWAIGQRFVERGNRDAARATVDSFVRALRRRPRAVLLAPEGTRTLDGTVGPFKRGAFRIAAEAQVPIVPFTIEGAFDLMPKGRAWCPPGEVLLTVHAPIDTTGWRAEDAGAHADAVRERFVAWVGAPPSS